MLNVAFSSCTRLLPNIRGISSQVRAVNEINIENLTALFTGKIAALRFPNFCPPNVVEDAMKHFRQRQIIEYANAQGVGKYVGTAYFETQDNEKMRNLYYATRLGNFKDLREIFHPHLSPIDKIRLILDETWPHGASLLDLGRGPMFVGLTRGMNGEILPHEDKLERDDPSTLAKVTCVAQIGFNCYLSMPKQGGELHLWDKTLSTREYDELRGNSYGISRDLLPPPVVSIRPEVGEWIAFNARYLHAVTGGSKDDVTRTSVSGFIAYQGPDQPLHFWS